MNHEQANRFLMMSPEQIIVGCEAQRRVPRDFQNKEENHKRDALKSLDNALAFESLKSAFFELLTDFHNTGYTLPSETVQSLSELRVLYGSHFDSLQKEELQQKIDIHGR